MSCGAGGDPSFLAFALQRWLGQTQQQAAITFCQTVLHKSYKTAKICVSSISNFEGFSYFTLIYITCPCKTHRCISVRW